MPVSVPLAMVPLVVKLRSAAWVEPEGAVAAVPRAAARDAEARIEGRDGKDMFDWLLARCGAGTGRAARQSLASRMPLPNVKKLKWLRSTP